MNARTIAIAGGLVLLFGCSSSDDFAAADVGQMDGDIPPNSCMSPDAPGCGSSTGLTEAPIPCTESRECEDGGVCAAVFTGLRPEAFECREACIPLLDDLAWCADAASCCDRGAICNARGYCLFADEPEPGESGTEGSSSTTDDGSDGTTTSDGTEGSSSTTDGGSTSET